MTNALKLESPTYTEDDVAAVRLLVRLREDFQSMRKRMDNRLGRKANGEQQNVEERAFRPEDLMNFTAVSDNARMQEKEIEKMLRKTLKRFPIYTHFLSQIKGIGPIAAGHIVGTYDIVKATTVSKLWQYTGLNPGMVRGKVRKDLPDGTFTLEVTDTLIRGDRLTPGFVAPFNKRLRTALVGVMADSFIKAKSPYALTYYYPYKERLAGEKSLINGRPEGKEKTWEETTKGHRDRAAKRYMIKMFLKDLYAAWRTLEGLPVRAPYQEEYLGHVHNA
jgi:hypothetical protein